MTRRLGIALITYQRPGSSQRTEYALRTIRSVVANLQLADAEIAWYVADDGSTDEHWHAVIDELTALDQKLLGAHHEHIGPGPGQTAAANACFEWSPVSLHLEDDWVLDSPYDVTKHYDLIMRPPEKYDVRMVRMGYLTVDTAWYVIGHDWVHYLLASRRTQYNFSGHPALRHREWWNAYGPYGDGDAGWCEIDMDARWRAKAGPEIVWPLDQSGWGRFTHIGGEKAG